MLPLSLMGLCSAGDDTLLIAGLLVALQVTCGTRGLTLHRQRKSFDELAVEYGACFDRAHRMSRKSFDKLCTMLDIQSSRHLRGPRSKGGTSRKKVLSFFRNLESEVLVIFLRRQNSVRNYVFMGGRFLIWTGSQSVTRVRSW